MKQYFINFVLLAFLLASLSFGQNSKIDIGMRLGSRTGLSARYYLYENARIEGILATRGCTKDYSYWHGILFASTYQQYSTLKIENIDDLSWFYGGGVHIGYWRRGSYYFRNDTWVNGRNLGLGVDGIIGAEYDLETLLNFPVSVSLDWKPAVGIIGKWTTKIFDIAVTFYYTFNRIIFNKRNGYSQL